MPDVTSHALPRTADAAADELVDTVLAAAVITLDWEDAATVSVTADGRRGVPR